MATPDWKDILAGMDVAPAPEHDPNEPDTVQSRNSTSAKSVTVFFERKGRAGKSVTILAEFTGLTNDEIKALASVLKQKLGCGGSYSDGEILIQGDRRSDIKKLLLEQGFKVKGAQ